MKKFWNLGEKLSVGLLTLHFTYSEKHFGIFLTKIIIVSFFCTLSEKFQDFQRNFLVYIVLKGILRVHRNILRYSKKREHDIPDWQIPETQKINFPMERFSFRNQKLRRKIPIRSATTCIFSAFRMEAFFRKILSYANLDNFSEFNKVSNFCRKTLESDAKTILRNNN